MPASACGFTAQRPEIAKLPTDRVSPLLWIIIVNTKEKMDVEKNRKDIFLLAFESKAGKYFLYLLSLPMVYMLSESISHEQVRALLVYIRCCTQRSIPFSLCGICDPGLRMSLIP